MKTFEFKLKNVVNKVVTLTIDELTFALALKKARKIAVKYGMVFTHNEE